MKILDRGLIYNAAAAAEAERFTAFDSLVRLSDGAILCTFKIGPQKLSTTDNVRIMRSTDEGRTWQEWFRDFDTTFAGTPGSLIAGYPFEVAPGDLRICCPWIDRTDPSRPLANPVTTGLLPLKCLIARSTDAGRHFGPFHEVSLAPHKGSAQTGEALRLNNGQWLLPYESWKDWDDVEGTQVAALRLSRDGGETWSRPVTLATDPFQDHYFWDNRLAVRPADGRLVAMFWTFSTVQKKDTDVHISWGRPDAREWTYPVPTGIKGQISTPLPLGGEALLCAYVHREDPAGLRVVLSRDFGRTWNLRDELVVYDSAQGRESGMGTAREEADYWQDMGRWTFGHPKALPLADGTVLVTFYAGSLKQLSMHWVRIGL